MKLVNFAIMPNEGQYKLREISKEEFVKIVQKNNVESYISFRSTAELLEKLTNKKIDVTKERCYFDESQDYLIVVLKNPVKFRKKLTADDFVFYYCEYKS